MNLENEIVRLVHMHQTEYWSDLEEMDIHGEPLELPEIKHILIQYVNHEKNQMHKYTKTQNACIRKRYECQQYNINLNASVPPTWR